MAFLHRVDTDFGILLLQDGYASKIFFLLGV